MSQDLRPLLYQALGQPIGLLLRTSNFVRARQRLYAARQLAGDPDLDQLQFRASPGLVGGDLIIVKERVQIPVAEAESEDVT